MVSKVQRRDYDLTGVLWSWHSGNNDVLVVTVEHQNCHKNRRNIEHDLLSANDMLRTLVVFCPKLDLSPRPGRVSDHITYE